MAKIVFRLRGVPEDEAKEVRELLTTHGVDYYETPAGNWGISMPAIWLRDEARLHEVTALLEDYQRNRQMQARRDYERMRRDGTHPTFLATLKSDPLRVVVSVAVVALVLYVSIRLVVDIAAR